MADNLPEPMSRKETFLAKAAGMTVSDLPTPESREEQYLNAIANGGGGGGTSYSAGDGINITNNTISVDTTTIQPKLTAGTNVAINDAIISATDTTYSNFTGTDGTAAGAAGLVPAPATADAGKFLKADGTWATAGGGSSTAGEPKVLTSADYNWNSVAHSATAPYDCIAPWLLSPGLYKFDMSVYVAIGPTDNKINNSVFNGRTALFMKEERGSGMYDGCIGILIYDANDNSLTVSFLGYSPDGTLQNNALNGSLLKRNDIVNSLTSNYTNKALSANQGKVLKGLIDGTTETYTIASNSWTALASSSPFTYQATITATYTIGASTTIELINDQPVQFATYGFSVGSVSGQNITIYSIGKPSASETLKITYRG